MLNFFEFNSDRKRASIIVRHEGVIKMYTKGADNIIIDRLKKGDEEVQPYLAFINEQLKFFSSKGLRTLCLAMRLLTEQEYSQMMKKIDACVGVCN